MDKFKKFLLIFSVVMFCYQFKTAIENLISPNLVDSTSIKNIEEINLPIITICPRNQLNKAKLKELGYVDFSNVLYGLQGNKASWGAVKNLSFHQVLEQVWNKQAVIQIHSADQTPLEAELVFVTKFGFCKSLRSYNPKSEIVISSEYSLRLFITDPNYSSYILPDFTSMKGSVILVNPGKIYFYDVQISALITCNKQNTDSYKNCVDEMIQKVFIPTMGCVPPWLSNRNQCNSIYPWDLAYNLPNYWNSYVWPAMSLLNLDEERSCKSNNFCDFQSIEARLRDVEEGPSAKFTRIHLNFQKDVSVTVKIPDYDFFKFVVDTGSSLGLWLGLSILGLWEHCLESITWIISSINLKLLRR